MRIVKKNGETIDGYSNMIYVSATGTIKIGYDPGDYTEIASSSITPRPAPFVEGTIEHQSGNIEIVAS